MAAPSASLPDEARERLKQFFLQTADTDMSRRWDDIWREDFLPFDRKVANPALDEALEKYVKFSAGPGGGRGGGNDKAETGGDRGGGGNDETETGVLPSPVDAATGRRRTALVPGCGRGYDVLLLAAYGFDAYGLDISATAMLAAEELKARIESVVVVEEGKSPDSAAAAAAAGPGFEPDQAGVYATRDPDGAGRGSARFLCGDFFAASTAGWTYPPGPRQAEYLAEKKPVPQHFDLIVDYTFLCAFPQSMRPAWAASMRSLLRPPSASTSASSSCGGRLLCVEFPTYKDPAVRGPPWAMPSRAYLAVLARPGCAVEYDGGLNAQISEADVATLERGEAVDSARGMVRVAHYKCTRTHAAGHDTDHVGIWRRAG